MARQRSWADTRYGGVDVVAGTDLLTDLLAVAPRVDTLTVVRIVAELNIGYTVTTTVADADSIVDIGIGVTAQEAFDAGVTSVPDPEDPSSYPPRGWIYVNTFMVAQLVTTDGGIIDHRATIRFDIRAMRKIDKGVLFLRLSQKNLNVGGVMDLTGRVRALCLT